MDIEQILPPDSGQAGYTSKNSKETRVTAENLRSEKARLMKACQDFEAIFISHLLKTMRTSQEEESELFGDGLGGEIFQDLFDSEMAKTLSTGEGMGLARRIFSDLERLLPDASQGPGSGGISSIRNPPGIGNVYQNHILDASRQYGVDPDLVRAVIQRESGGDPNSVSSKGAKGLMQLMDETASEMGVRNSRDPRENIMGGTRYLRILLNRFGGDVQLALAAYNAGPAAVEQYGGIPPYRETREYVGRVLETYRQAKTKAGDPVNGLV